MAAKADEGSSSERVNRQYTPTSPNFLGSRRAASAPLSPDTLPECTRRGPARQARLHRRPRGNLSAMFEESETDEVVTVGATQLRLPPDGVRRLTSFGTLGVVNLAKECLWRAPPKKGFFRRRLPCRVCRRPLADGSAPGVFDLVIENPGGGPSLTARLTAPARGCPVGHFNLVDADEAVRAVNAVADRCDLPRGAGPD
jgi:hypothetical protein